MFLLEDRSQAAYCEWPNRWRHLDAFKSWRHGVRRKKYNQIAKNTKKKRKYQNLIFR